jgi:hypothetical protein
MLKKVQISDRNSGRIVAEYPIVLEILGVSSKDYCKEAWENAIDEGVVDPTKTARYEVEVVNDIWDKQR